MIAWLAQPVTWIPELPEVGVTVEANDWGWRDNCYAACRLECAKLTAGRAVPLVTDYCAKRCYADSDCTALPYGTKAEYDAAAAKTEAAIEAAQKKAAEESAAAKPPPPPPPPPPTAPYGEKYIFYPWKKFAPETKALQDVVNKKLVADGLCPLDADGKLGPGTCGAAKRYGLDPSTCLMFTAPEVCLKPPPAAPVPSKPGGVSRGAGLTAGAVVIGVAAAILIATLAIRSSPLPNPDRRTEIAFALDGAVQGWLSLADLNRLLKDQGYRATTEREAARLGFPVERHRAASGKLKAVEVYRDEAAYERGSWRVSGRELGRAERVRG